jgi:hypothetical protein
MSIVIAEPGPTEPEPVEADAPVKVTVPQLASGTRPEFSSKSSTIHSASCSQSADDEVIDLETDCPFELFLITAVPEVVVLAVTVSVTESPALNEMPEKS